MLPVQLYVPTWLAVPNLGVRVHVVAVLAAGGTVVRLVALNVVAVTVCSLPTVSRLTVSGVVAQITSGAVSIFATLWTTLTVDNSLAGQGTGRDGWDTLVVLAHLPNLALVVGQTTCKYLYRPLPRYRLYLGP